jgi:hypothetical protein
MLDGAHAQTLRGRALITPAGDAEVLEGDDPLRYYAEEPVDRRAIAQLAQWSNSGDLILFGAYDHKRDRCICFDDQVGAHGALGGVQGRPFIMAPRGLIPDGYPIDDPLDLYQLFRRYTEPADLPILERHEDERRVAILPDVEG